MQATIPVSAVELGRQGRGFFKGYFILQVDELSPLFVWISYNRINLLKIVGQ